MNENVTNRILIEVLMEELEARSLDFEQWEKSVGLTPGNLHSALVPLDERAIHRNIKLIAMYLGFESNEFFDRLVARAEG